MYKILLFIIITGFLLTTLLGELFINFYLFILIYLFSFPYLLFIFTLRPLI